MNINIETNTTQLITTEQLDILAKYLCGVKLTIEDFGVPVWDVDSISEDGINARCAMIYKDSADALALKGINVDYTTQYIRILDPEVLRVLFANGIGDGVGVTSAQASNTVANFFYNNTTIKSFDELKYFKAGNYDFRGCTNLKSIDITGKENTVNCLNLENLEYFHGSNSEKGYLETGHTGLNFNGCLGIKTLKLTSQANLITPAYNGSNNIKKVIWRCKPGVALGAYSFEKSPVEVLDILSIEDWFTHSFGLFSNPMLRKTAKLMIGDQEITLVEVPLSVTTINKHLFNGSRIVSCVFHNNITCIQEGAFWDCDALIISNLNLPNLTNIEKNAFLNCVNLIGNLSLPSVSLIEQKAFDGCSSLTTVDIPNATSIGTAAFARCTSLTTISISNSISTIPADFCLECSSLTSISIPSTVTTIGHQAFRGCSNLVITDLNLPNLTTLDYTAFRDTKLRKVSDLGSVRIINDGVFGFCSELTSIDLTDMTQILSGPFSGCINLEYFGGDGSTSGELYLPNLTYMKQYAFQNCKKLKTITDLGSVLSIPNNCFSGCTSLTNVSLPNTLTSIENSAFSECRGLTSITIPNSVTSFGREAFVRCTGLQHIVIPDSVTSIGDACFSGCHAVIDCTIGTGITTIGAEALRYWPNAQSITIKATTPPTLKNAALANLSNSCVIYVPSSSVSAYQSASGWSTYASRIQAIPTT